MILIPFTDQTKTLNLIVCKIKTNWLYIFSCVRIQYVMDINWLTQSMFICLSTKWSLIRIRQVREFYWTFWGRVNRMCWGRHTFHPSVPSSTNRFYYFCLIGNSVRNGDGKGLVPLKDVKESKVSVTFFWLKQRVCNYFTRNVDGGSGVRGPTVDGRNPYGLVLSSTSLFLSTIKLFPTSPP